MRGEALARQELVDGIIKVDIEPARLAVDARERPAIGAEELRE